MAVIITNPSKHAEASVPISEQNKIIIWLKRQIEFADFFENYEINYNNLRTDVSNVSIIQNQGAVKSKQYVDGGYDGIIPVQIVVRTLSLTAEENKLHVIDLLNQLGMWFDENIHYNKEILGFTIYSVSQQTVAVIGYADESGLVDVVADFRITYSKN